MVIGRRVVVGSMRYDVRWTEELLIKALFTFHPELANDGLLYDGSEERRSNYTPRGRRRPLPPPRPAGARASASGRSPAALDELCDTVFAQGAVTDVIVVVMPKAPTAIHLDMIFTQVDRELCVVYPPFFVGPERLPVLHRRKGEAGVHEMPNFFDALREVGLPMEAVFAGGQHRTSQEREQWSSACNFLAVRPGTIVSYRRNDATLCELQAAGLPDRAGGQLPGVRRLDRRQAPHRDHHRRGRARPGRRRAALHVAAAPAGAAVIGTVGPPREHAARPRARTPARRARAGRDALPPGARPGRRPGGGVRADRRRAARRRSPGPAARPTAAGDWCPRRRGSPLLDDCAFAVVDVETTGMRAARRRPDHRDRRGGGPRRPPRGRSSTRWSIRAGRFRRPSAPSPTSPTPWSGTRRRSPSVADQVVGRPGGPGVRRPQRAVRLGFRERGDAPGAGPRPRRPAALHRPPGPAAGEGRPLLRARQPDAALRLRERGPAPRRGRRAGHRRPARAAAPAGAGGGRAHPAGPQRDRAPARPARARRKRLAMPDRAEGGLAAGKAAGVTLAHAFQVGRLRCHTLEGGLQRLDGGAMFGVVPRTLWSTRVAPDERHRIPLAMRCLLVEHPDGLVLVDTALGNKEERASSSTSTGSRTPGLEGATQLEDALAAAGFLPDGRALGDQYPPAFRPCGRQHHAWTRSWRTTRGATSGPTFPNATYVVQRGRAGVRPPHQRADPGELPAAQLRADRGRGPLAAARGRRRGAAGDLGPADARATCRSTRRCWCASGGETAAFIADLIPTAAHLPLPWIMGYDLEPLRTLESKRALLRDAAAGGWRLVFEHDPRVASGVPVAEGKGVRAARGGRAPSGGPGRGRSS